MSPWRHRYSVLAVPVAGGSLRVGEWAGEGPTVVLLHGISAHHLAWSFLADALPDHRLLAPDLRGRGGSRGLPGPWGLARHADDVADLIADQETGPVTVVGHSMGAFIAVVLAHRDPDLVRSAVLVDGGLPFAPAESATTEAVLATIRQRLESTFPDAEAYRELFRQHPAFAHDWTFEVEAYVRYDTVGSPPHVHSAAQVEAVLEDQRDIGEGGLVAEALDTRTRPLRWLHAPRGFLDDPPGLYAADTVEDLRSRYPDVEASLVPDVNHYTIVMSERGAAAVADAVRAASG